MYTLGSFCTGFGGLDLAVEAVLGPAQHLWHAEFNADKAKILAAHWPTVPNLGDITTVDWAEVPRPDVVTGGFPCQDISVAGRRAGLGVGTRSGIWSNIADAVNILRPRLCLFENVRALLSTKANRADGTDSCVEPGPAGVGGGADGPVLRAAGAVCGDLADIGYDAAWQVVAASDVGAPHRRERVFIVAWPADSEGVGHWHARAQGFAGVPAAAVAGGVGGGGVSLLPTPTAADTTGAGHAAQGGQNLRTVAALLPTSAARLGDKWGMPSTDTVANRLGSGRRNLEDAVALLPTPTARDGDGRGEGSPDYWAQREGREHGQGAPLGAVVNLLPTPRATDGAKGGPNQRGSSGDLMLPSAVIHMSSTISVSDEESDVDQSKTGPGKVLRNVRRPYGSEAVRVSPGGSGPLQGSPVLHTEMRQHASGGEEGHASLARSAAPCCVMSPMWDPSWSSRSPQGQEPSQQRTSEPRNAVCLMPPSTALEGGSREENGCPRFGRYAAAVHRWEGVVGSPSPDPTETGTKGQRRLSPHFVEFLMGLPAGWVTDHVGRNAALHALGDGVVWRQGAHALRALLAAAASTPLREVA